MTKHCEVLTTWQRSVGRNEMSVAADYPATWTDVTGQQGELINAGADVFVARGEVSDAQLSALQADPNYAVIWAMDEPNAPPELTSQQIALLREKMTAMIAPDIVKLATLDTTSSAAIAATIIDAQRRPVWQAGITVLAGDVYQHERNLYEVIQPHTTQSDWLPDISVALWKRFYEPTDDPREWHQPVGAHDAYPVGARVLFEGDVWVNTINANVWQPGVTGWQREGGEPEPTPDWKAGVAYKVGDVVLYQGSSYRCLQAHTSQAGWTPTAVPALWKRL